MNVSICENKIFVHCKRFDLMGKTVRYNIRSRIPHCIMEEY